jgi:hypothetical protein
MKPAKLALEKKPGQNLTGWRENQKAFLRSTVPPITARFPET